MATGGIPIGHVALLRGVNVGGRNRIAMDALRQIATALGFVGARTHLQSGNLVFLAPDGEGAAIEEALRLAIAQQRGIDVPVFVRTQPAMAAAIGANPFAEAASGDPSHLLVTFSSGAPRRDRLAAIAAAARLGERVELVGRELFIHYAGGVAGSRLTTALIDRELGVTGTARNWTTVLALEALARSVADTPAN
ncbi:MAG TPA: DUF1697 domain-containing protein [Caulobacteraceae bacterium]|nr:DUF1697 domain-containing protein [Caulobacteraceae bacterium]